MASIAAGILTGYAAISLIRSLRASTTIDRSGLGTFEHGFVTERICTDNFWPIILRAIVDTFPLVPTSKYEIELQRFTGSVEWLSNGTEVLVLDPSERPYVGDPSPAIDQAWEDLVEARYWSISEREARMLWGVGYAQYRDHVHEAAPQFLTEDDKNMIRKRLNSEYYTMPHFGGAEHDMHCIEQIRQRLQCSASGTITPARYSKNLPGMYVDSQQVHTCRNFDRLWEYTRERYNGSLVVPRKQWY
ncbi:hypothetical protein CERZMDRAFT_37986 [Cercospora zeae-maydis SCOH1-5]|uniref:Uncharacterized protein n=1 Tax=Cercospora zeae-maydis SCOH1-5 TaxID=717836 RepID=A0A6A6FLA7_9PEZI|nr:hypothetical protein CERZMDRAFT_37986 [Cercospora zeae-maydis SCOH1-5]